MTRPAEVQVSERTHLATGTTGKISLEHCFEEFPGTRVCYEWLSETRTYQLKTIEPFPSISYHCL